LRPVMESDLDYTVVRFSRILLLSSRRKLHASRKSDQSKALSPDEAAGILLALLANINAWRRSPSSN